MTKLHTSLIAAGLLGLALSTTVNKADAAPLSNYDNLVAHCGVGVGLALLDADPSGRASAEAANKFIIMAADNPRAALIYSDTVLEEGIRQYNKGPGGFQQFLRTLTAACNTLVK